MKEKLISGDEMDAIWARDVLNTFSNHARAKKTKKRIHKRRRAIERRELKNNEGDYDC